ncbi:hypothetical protein D9Q98_010439 [Chlorella vulgaris]|uniref:Pinin/SDK/MemA protein domain-containing protein n=1 Tax=Chlorella vulgaris TaxID=3077 RepID=A0A9D4TS71_CHLVU|nr:hypothetical protein D9Q98_010439 [Chlorella vulgaris]
MDRHTSKAPLPPRRSLVSSAVVASDTHSSLKRPAETLLEEHADVKQRNKRLYAGLLGTLQRFSREEAQIQNTTAAQRRAEVERRAAEKAEEGSRRLRQQARDEMRRSREGEIARKRELNAQAACQRLAALYATRLARADKLTSRLLLTATTPQLYWCPAKSCAEVEDSILKAGQATRHVAWKAAVLEELAAEQAVLMQKMTQRPTGRGPMGHEMGAAMDTMDVGAATVDTNDEGAVPAAGDEKPQPQLDAEMFGTDIQEAGGDQLAPGDDEASNDLQAAVEDIQDAGNDIQEAAEDVREALKE